MGRFKIYDSKKLVNILSDPNYAKCLLCERILKNIMGNIKRHYEQMHSVCLDADVTKTRKSKKKSVKHKKSDTNNVATTVTARGGKTYADISNNFSRNWVPTHTVSMTETKAFCQLSSAGTERIFNSQEATHLNGPTNIPQQNCLRNESKLETYPKAESQANQSMADLNSEKIKLNKEDDEIQVPCHSYINSIHVSSLDSCNHVDFLTLLVDTKAQMKIPLKNLHKGDTFQNTLQNWKQHFQFSYSSQTIGEHLDRMAKKLRQEITKNSINKIIYLKLDIAFIKGSKVMLVNIQFINDFEIKVLTLKALELLDDDLATFLKEKVIKTLDGYQIDINMVCSITKDNTNNVRKCHKSYKDDAQSSVKQEEWDVGKMYSPTNDYCLHLCESYPGHAIHFVARDIITQLHENISQSRDSVKSLIKELPKLNISDLPSMDNTSSWFSVYDMIKSLLDVRDVVESNNLTIEVDWLFAIKFIASFTPVVATASILQTNNFVMGDFYREWLLCEIELEELSGSNELALYLLKAMHKRKVVLFENASFLAALYLDARFCHMGSMYLNEKQKEVAMVYLLEIFTKLKALPSPNEPGINHKDRYSKLEKYTITNLKTELEVPTPLDTSHLGNVDQQWVKESLEQLQFEERLSFNTNILEYWKMAKYKSPILAKIAEVVLAAPATQATIHRAINAAPLILMNGKLNDCPDIIENLLLLKLNQDMVNEITLQ